MRLPGTLEPLAYFRLLVAAILIAAAVCLCLVLYELVTIDSRSHTAKSLNVAAAGTAMAEAELTQMQSLIRDRWDDYLESPEVMSLSSATRTDLEEALASPSGELSRRLEGPPIAFDMAAAVAFQSSVSNLQAVLSRQVDVAGTDAERAEIARLTSDANETLAAYYSDPTPANFIALSREIDGLVTLTRTEALRLSAQAQAAWEDVDSAVTLGYIALPAAVVLAGTTVMFLSLRLGNAMHRRIANDIKEQAELAAATSRLSFRNEQLSALHNVFSEITDTLNLAYVVRTALTESLGILRADMASLRVLRGQELIVAGAMSADGSELRNLNAVRLGEGPTGRTAKRGRTLRIDSGGERLMSATLESRGESSISPSQQTNQSPMQSGLIVPLVVGARVVGTLACWSRMESAFNDEDQRILEMIASQVAAAIAAAEATEESERQAHIDALTSLPNRRQLDEDLRGTLADLRERPGSAVVAMLDIDYFKRLNDQYGHRAGDLTLQRVAATIRSSIREDDYAYRFGGEEFVVVFPDTTLEEAVPLANRIRTAIRRAAIVSDNNETIGPVTISIGLALLPEHGNDMTSLIDLADKAMYHAKYAGRDCVVVWDEDTLTKTEKPAA